MDRSSLSHHLVALWFADIAGYSEVASGDERGAMQLVEILQELSRAAIRRHDGRIVKFLGDAVLAEFPSTEQAVRAAVFLSGEYADRSAAAGRAAHGLRVGVHIGDVVVGADGDLYGDGVNAAARVQSSAEPGQVVVSEDVWRQLRARRGFRFEALGERELKGVGRIGLYEVGVEAVDAPVAGDPGARVEGESPRIGSIAVLPFADLSPERDHEYFGDGMAEEILDALAKVEGLRVPARTSCFAFRGRGVDVREIGARLGVEAVLEGSVRKAGLRLRITAQLIDARNGYHMWSERFDRELEDVFTIQEEIARRILDALGFSRTAREVLKGPTTSVGAYDFYLRGRKLFQKWTKQNVQFAARMFARAIEIDSSFAAAWAGLATAEIHLFRWGREPELLERASSSCVRALQLDPSLAEAHVAAGQVRSMERRYEEAEREFEQAIELDPSMFDAHYYYARSAFEAGQFEKSVRLYEAAHDLRPEDYQSLTLMSSPLRKLGRVDEAGRADARAIECIEKSLEIDPTDARAYNLGAVVLANLGEGERARQWTRQAAALAPDDPVVLYNNACTLAVLGLDDEALDALELAIAARVSHWDWITKDPDWERLREHPRFRELLARIAPADPGEGVHRNETPERRDAGGSASGEDGGGSP
jgi:adenylate cyclase